MRQATAAYALPTTFTLRRTAYPWAASSCSREPHAESRLPWAPGPQGVSPLDPREADRTQLVPTQNGEAKPLTQPRRLLHFSLALAASCCLA